MGICFPRFLRLPLKCLSPVLLVRLSGPLCLSFLGAGFEIPDQGTMAASKSISPTVYAFNRPPQLYEKFSVNGFYVSPAFYTETITGIEGTFTQNLTMTYANSQYPYIFFGVIPVSNAFPLLQNVASEPVILMTANDKLFYKTIASSIEFGHLGQPDAHKPRSQLMSGILQFFDLGYLVTSTREIESANHSKLLLSPNPVAQTLSIEMSGANPYPEKILIYNTMGQLVINQSLGTDTVSSIVLDVRSLKPGPYFFYLNGKKRNYKGVIIKQ